jgi:hypothetical protein
MAHHLHGRQICEIVVRQWWKESSNKDVTATTTSPISIQRQVTIGVLNTPWQEQALRTMSE